MEQRMTIYIPSSGRAHKQTTAENLPDELKDVVITVVPHAEAEEYRRAGMTQVAAPTIPKGIGHARQWCCDQESRKVIMLDDDLVFATRRKDRPTTFFPATDKEMVNMFKDVERLLDNFYAVGVSPREGANWDTEGYTNNVRMLRCLAYRTDILRANDIRFDQMDVMEDFYVALSLLTRGFGNVNLNYMVQNQNGSGLEGGCSQYRDAEMQKRAAEELKRKFPEFVTVMQKKTKDAWGGGTRTDVRVRWKQACKAGLRSR